MLYDMFGRHVQHTMHVLHYMLVERCLIQQISVKERLGVGDFLRVWEFEESYSDDAGDGDLPKHQHSIHMCPGLSLTQPIYSPNRQER